MTTSPSQAEFSPSPSNGVSGSSLSPFRSFLSMLNWRRDPERLMRLKELERKELLLEQRTRQLEKKLAVLKWMHSEIDLIEAVLPSSSTPPQPTAPNSYDC